MSVASHLHFTSYKLNQIVWTSTFAFWTTKISMHDGCRKDKWITKCFSYSDSGRKIPGIRITPVILSMFFTWYRTSVGIEFRSGVSLNPQISDQVDKYPSILFRSSPGCLIHSTETQTYQTDLCAPSDSPFSTDAIRLNNEIKGKPHNQFWIKPDINNKSGSTL